MFRFAVYATPYPSLLIRDIRLDQGSWRWLAMHRCPSWRWVSLESPRSRVVSSIPFLFLTASRLQTARGAQPQVAVGAVAMVQAAAAVLVAAAVAAAVVAEAAVAVVAETEAVVAASGCAKLASVDIPMRELLGELV